MKYRREVDGLRALAVVPVILFHARFDAFRGGFVGVNIFFVISGYLITSIILTELERDSFSIVDFYERRARRIVPALFLVMGVCIPFAWLLLLPGDMKEFSQSLAAVAVFASNVLFWSTSDYFETAADLKPLLHTWSLAVEEQFYLLFPVLLVLGWRAGRKWLIAVLAIVAVLSFALANHHAATDRAFAFFLLPTRIWELAIGALVAFHLAESHAPRSPWINQCLSALGLLLIFYGIFAFTEETPFPSAYALAPTVGAALIIIYAMPDTHAGRLLGSKMFVSIGLISYSAYLWHQPVFAFARHASLNEPSTLAFAVLSLLSLVLAYFSWRFVEQPFRRRSVIDRANVFSLAIAGSLCLLLFGITGHLTNGYLESRYAGLTDRQKSMLENKHEDGRMNDNGDCNFHSTEIDHNTIIRRFDDCYQKYGRALIILGDSHAMDLYQALTLNVNTPFLVGVSHGWCSQRAYTERPGCHFERLERFIEDHHDKVHTILYTQTGSHLLTDEARTLGGAKLFLKKDVPVYTPNDLLVNRVRRYLHRVGKDVGVVWLGPRIEPHVNVSHLVASSIDCAAIDIRIPRGTVRSFRALDEYLERQFQNDPVISYVSQIDALSFNEAHDLVGCNEVYWSDGHHWSSSGERRFGARIVSYMRSKGLLR